MLSIKLLVIDVLSKLGSFFCCKAIQLAGKGHINFEVSNYDNPTSLLFQTKQDFFTYTRIEKTIKCVLFCLFISSIIWVGLEITVSIERSCDQITTELKKEHKEDIFYKNFSQ